MYVYIYIYIYIMIIISIMLHYIICMRVCIYIYIYIASQLVGRELKRPASRLDSLHHDASVGHHLDITV